MKKRILSLLLLAVMLLALAGCGDIKDDTVNEVELRAKYTVSEQATNYVLIEMEDGGKMLLELFPDKAPITVANFQKLVGEGFYDGIIFHRVIENFMIQGGDPLGTGYGGSDETITGEFSANGIANDISHTRGTISMGRLSGDNNSASSQFFICHVDYPYLDGNYAAFGRMIDGFDTLDKIATTKTDSSDKPVNEQKMKRVVFVTLDEQ